MPWGELLLGSCAALLSMGGMLNFAPMLPLLQKEFGLSNTWGGILISATVLTHTLMMLPGGQIVDTIGAKRAMVASGLLIGIDLIASGFSAGFEMLLVCRLILGMGTGLALVSGLAFVNSMVPPARRPIAQGIYGSGANAGVLVVLLFSDRLSGFGGWRGAFLVEGVFAILCALLSIAYLRATPPRRQADAVGWGTVFRRKPLYLLGLANALTYGSFMAIAAWAATFLWKTDGVTLAAAGPIAAIMAASSVLGRALGGALSAGRERQTIVGTCLITAACIGLAPLMPDIVPRVVALLAFGWFSSLPFGAIFSTTSRVSDPSSAGRSFGVVTFVSNLGALSFPPLIGSVLDATGSFALGFGIVAAVCLAGSAALALWLPTVHSPRSQTRASDPA